MYYALSTDDPETGYHIYGKGDDAAQAETDAARHIHDDLENADVLRRNLTVITREEAEERGVAQPGAPVIWYDRLSRYRVEAHGPYRPLPGEQMARSILR